MTYRNFKKLRRDKLWSDLKSTDEILIFGVQDK